MDQLNISIDELSQYEESSILNVPGVYNARSIKAEVITTQNPDNPKKLRLTFEVEDGAQMGKTFREDLNIWHQKSDKARSIAEQHLRLLMESLGIRNTSTTDDLIGARAVLTVSENGTYVDKNGVERTRYGVSRWERANATASNSRPVAHSTEARPRKPWEK